MFNFFRRNKAQTFSPEYLADQIKGAINQGLSDYCINFWIKDQILFQVGLTRNFVERNIKLDSQDDRVIIHFFNKNKTHTVHAWESFKVNYNELGLTYYEEPSKHDNFIKNLGSDPKKISEEIFNAIEMYELPDLSEVHYEIVQY